MEKINKFKSAAAAVIALEVIVGVWNVYTPDKGSFFVQEAAKTSGKLFMPTGGLRCTAWKVAPKHYMTNNHCFWHKDSLPVIFEGKECNEIVATEHGEHFDYTLFKCENDDDRPYIYMANTAPINGDPVHIIQYNCNYADIPTCKPELVVSDGKIINQNSALMNMDYDSLGGSSGSLIINSKGQAIGLHNLGYPKGRAGYGTHNSSVKLTLILDNLLEKGIDIHQMQKEGNQKPIEIPVFVAPKEKKNWSGLFSSIN